MLLASSRKLLGLALRMLNLLLCEDIVEHLHQHREILSLIICRKDDRIFVLRAALCHLEHTLKQGSLSWSLKMLYVLLWLRVNMQHFLVCAK